MARVVFFSDLPLNFIANPVTGDVSPVTNEAAVKSALINLMRTSPGERPFQNDYGVDIERYLFQPNDVFLEMELNDEIAYAIKTHEKRAQLIAIETRMEEYGIDISIEYSILNYPGVHTLNTTVSRTK